MAFLNKLKSAPLPPLKNILNVAVQTARQHMPDKKDYEQPGGGRPTMPQQPDSTQAMFQGDENTYGTTDDRPTELNPFRNPNGWMDEGDGGEAKGEGYQTTSFNEYDGRYQQADAIRQGSIASEGSSFVCEGEGGGGSKIDEMQAAWNVTNAIQGMFIVSLPFAVLHGGYWAIIAMVGIAYICCYTGKVLVQCLYEPDPATGQLVRVRDSYVSIAKVCFGPQLGARAVSIAQLIELLMTCILYVVVCGDLLAGTYPQGSLDSRSWMMLVGIFLLPMGFLKSLKMVSLLSFWCTMSHIVINVVILGYCILQIGDWGWSKVRWSIDFENFPISLGVIVFSYTSQIFLPTLEGNMIDRSKFNWMLDWSHIAAAAFKAGFGYICFLTFQNDTQQVITNNLHSQGFKGLVNFFLVIKAILSYPLPYYAACELLERNFFRGPPKTKFPTIWHLDGELKVWGLGFRVGVIVSTIMMACFIPHFSILMGFIGSFTGTMLSFIWPCYFHLKIKGHLLDQKEMAKDYIIIGLGVLFGVIGIYDSGNALINAFEIGLPF
ncbi:vesicular inhibitory amino acid transporter-like isoform X1 [Musca domestica]|uniref:Vesicular inhibitory amino acid transporter n=2 Tax=Musca domestica TaxID=7370 RepID=A0A1I8MYN8_MUSDO|nr:vesicular inhibitory amino acid transporter isoform X1 [Musca domestica]XP_058981052.1 vesicular inhibitory amino acid transporter-like isoform X1 [Musca domestica]